MKAALQSLGGASRLAASRSSLECTWLHAALSVVAAWETGAAPGSVHGPLSHGLLDIQLSKMAPEFSVS